METTTFLTETYDLTDRKIQVFLPILEVLFVVYLLYAPFAVYLGFYIAFVGPIFASALAGWMFLLKGAEILKNRFFLLMLAISGTYVAIQLFIFHESLREPSISIFVLWIILTFFMIGMVQKPGFLLLTASMLLFISLMVYPLMVQFSTVSYYRLRLLPSMNTGFDNPNAYAAYAGFSVLIFWMLAIATSAPLKRALFLIAFLVGLFLVVQTVSRAALLALFLAIVVNFRSQNISARLLRIGSVAVIITAFLGLAYLYVPSITNIFSQSAQSYQTRALEDTGRLEIWQTFGESLRENPFTGAGASDTVLRIEFSTYSRRASPHNLFLYMWYSSGLIPLILMLILYIVLWIRSFRFKPEKSQLDPLPMILYLSLIAMVSTLTALVVWGCIVVAYCATVSHAKPAEEPVV
jgi:O-antigen ligase